MSAEGMDLGMDDINDEMDHEEINFDIESPRGGPMDLLNLLQKASVNPTPMPSDEIADSLNEADKDAVNIGDTIDASVKRTEKYSDTVCISNPDEIVLTNLDINVNTTAVGIEDSHSLEGVKYEAIIPPPPDFNTTDNESAITAHDVYVRQSKEFTNLQNVESNTTDTREKSVSEMVSHSTSFTTHSTFTHSFEKSSKTSLVTGLVSLDSIIVSEKQGEDSDSEFDFELPPATVASSNVPSQHAELTIAISSVEAQKPAATHSMHMEDSHREATLGPVVSPVLQSSASKPVAVIKPTTQTPPKQQFTVVQQTVSVAMDTVSQQRDRNLEAAQEEWDRVNTVQAGFQDSSTGGRGAEPTVLETIKPISMFELTESLKIEDFSKVKASIKCSVERRGLAAFVNFLFGPPKLHRDLMDERERLFCLAATQLSNENSLHMRTLQTIYRSLTGSKFDCPRLGSHWEEIGFQGNDPATDLRGAGVLGLMNLLYILKDPKTMSLASDIYRLSLHPTQNFPFCVMGINLSRITLQTLREDMLNRECNRRGGVMAVVNEFYAGLYLQLYQVWKSQGKTISDSGYVIKDIEIQAKKNPREILKHLEDYLNKKTHVHVVADKHDKFQPSGDDNFINICDDK